MKNFFIIQLSRGAPIPIDAEELGDVLRGLRTRQPVIVKRGIFNPAYFVAIVEDFDRAAGWNRDLGGTEGKVMATSKDPLQDLFKYVRGQVMRPISGNEIASKGPSSDSE